LKLDPVEDMALEIDYRERGLFAHEILASLHRRVNALRGSPSTPAALAPDEYERVLTEVLAEVLLAVGHDSVRDALREVDRRILRKWMTDYREQLVRYDAEWTQCETPLCSELFEVSFGRPLGEHSGPPSVDAPLELDFQGQIVRLSGRIDRIDTGKVHGQTVFNVLDYKTGSTARFSIDAVARGTLLQLPLYALAAAELILNDRDALPWWAGYWYLSADGFKPKQALKMYAASGDSLEPTQSWEEIRALLARTVAGLVRGMREAQFPVWSADADCTGRCPFNTVCRINQVRSLEKTWQPPVP
jgi:ATP-dependent helicase/DNAse subunit B